MVVVNKKVGDRGMGGHSRSEITLPITQSSELCLCTIWVSRGREVHQASSMKRAASMPISAKSLPRAQLKG
eukprot:scaffold331_cov123-Skeletonema_dohrnii-CCMP3373.AAC.2